MDTRKSEETRPKAASHDSETPRALVEFMQGGWIDRPIAVSATPHLDRCIERRAALSRAFPDAHVIVPAGVEHVRANDTFFRFRPSSDFAYLMGPGEPGSLLVLEPTGDGHRTLLFVAAHNRGTQAFFTDRNYGELWVGRHRGVDESQLYFGVDRCRGLDDIESYLTDLSRSKSRTCVVRGHDANVDAWVLPNDDDAALATHLAEMRLYKDDSEIAELRKAVEITKRGFEDAIRVMRFGTSERHIEAAFWARARIEANDVGYLTIAAAGHHACTLHWNRNNGSLSRDAMLLLDAGVECDSLYTADVTRTLPIGGTFSTHARAVHEIVWEAQRAGFAAVKPGNDFLEPNRAAMRVLTEGLIDLGVLTCSLDEALDPSKQYYRRYTLHNVSHMLGLDVHDCAKARNEHYRFGQLRERMALTVEPGLYFQPDDATVPEHLRGIGVRIEDDVVVTNDGCDNLSAILPSRATDVEHWIAETWAGKG